MKLKWKLNLVVLSAVLAGVALCSCRRSQEETNRQPEITAAMAFEGVSNYCHSAYEWSVAADNPDIMYVKQGEETATEYQVVFRSYTSVLVYFYVNKTNGTTRMVEYVPSLDISSEAGSFVLSDYLEKKE